MEEDESQPFLRTTFNVCSENLERVLSELDWHLEHSWLIETLKTTMEMENLFQSAHDCAERLVNVKDSVFKLFLDLVQSIQF